MKYPTEYQECRAYWDWAQYNTVLREYLIHNVNEGKRSSIFGRMLNLIGMRKGIPDYHLPIANDKYIGLWIEMKTRDKFNKKMPCEQVEWRERLLRANHYATFCYGFEDAKKVTVDYLENRI